MVHTCHGYIFLLQAVGFEETTQFQGNASIFQNNIIIKGDDDVNRSDTVAPLEFQTSYRSKNTAHDVIL